MNLVNEIPLAEERIRSFIRETPLDYSYVLSKATQAHVYVKLENLQVTGSFKIRGALNKLLSLSSDQQNRGVVAASTGNHGAAVAFGLRKLGLDGLIFVAENADSTKVETIRNFGVPVEFQGSDCVMAEAYARDYAAQHKMTYISPYNDRDVVSGQGTVGIELHRQLKNIDAVFVPVGGGGLIAGISTYLKSHVPTIKMIGCLPQNSPIMAESIQAGRIVNRAVLPTLSDATAGGIEEGAITFDLCRQLVDDYILVSEEDIKEAIKLFINAHHMLIEGASGVALAGLLKSQKKFKNKNVVVVLSGANISLDTLTSVICKC